MGVRLGLLFVVIAGLLAAQRKQVAVTIDDLPWAQSLEGQCDYDRLTAQTKRLLAPIRADHMPVTAFAIAGNCPNLSDDQYRAVLRQWMDAGAQIGNHTYSHRGLNTSPIAEYEADILKADEKLRRLTGQEKIEFFRSPMLQTGPVPETKERLESFLAAHGYRQSPVTFDNSDWMFAYVLAHARKRSDETLAQRVKAEYVPYMESVIAFFEKRSVELVGRDFPQILLIHANDLNAELLPDLLGMLRKRGYDFISLPQALQDPVYGMQNTYAGTGGFSWIHRWTKSVPRPDLKGGEPDEPRWLVDAYERMK